VVLRPRDARADVREDEVGPAVEGNKAVACGELNAQLPFIGADHLLEGSDFHDVSFAVT